MIIDHIEWCKSVLGTAAVQRPCIFGDLEGCIDKDVYNPEDPCKLKFCKIASAKLRSHQYCFMHDKLCPLFTDATASGLETAGLPCTDSSKAGLKQFEEGPTFGVFACHAKRHIQKGTKVILLENVQAHPSSNFLLMFPKVNTEFISF